MTSDDDDGGAHQNDEAAIARQPFTTRAGNVTEILRDLQSGLRGIEDGEQPEIPGDEKAGELSESELRPLIEAALERHRGDSGG